MQLHYLHWIIDAGHMRRQNYTASWSYVVPLLITNSYVSCQRNRNITWLMASIIFPVIRLVTYSQPASAVKSAPKTFWRQSHVTSDLMPVLAYKEYIVEYVIGYRQRICFFCTFLWTCFILSFRNGAATYWIPACTQLCVNLRQIHIIIIIIFRPHRMHSCLLYTSDAADE